MVVLTIFLVSLPTGELEFARHGIHVTLGVLGHAVAAARLVAREDAAFFRLADEQAGGAEPSPVEIALLNLSVKIGALEFKGRDEVPAGLR